MKPWFPHFFYLIVLAACALYYQRTLQDKSQLLAFLKRPTNDAYTVVLQNNIIIKAYVDLIVSAYRNSYNLLIEQRKDQADSLSKRALSGNLTMDSLRIGLEALVVNERIVEAALGRTLPPRNVQNLSETARFLLLQSDSLRVQIAFNQMLNCFAIKMGCEEIQFENFRPVFSPTTLCSPAGQPFQMDAFLSTRTSRLPIHKISINGEQLAIENNLAHYRHTFETPGDYPLKVEARATVYNFLDDSLRVAQKTFSIHVNR